MARQAAGSSAGTRELILAQLSALCALRLRALSCRPSLALRPVLGWPDPADSQLRGPERPGYPSGSAFGRGAQELTGEMPLSTPRFLLSAGALDADDIERLAAD